MDAAQENWSFKETVRRILPYFKPYRRRLLTGFFCIALTDFFAVLAPLVLKVGIQDLEAGITGYKITLYAGTIVLIALIAGVFRYLMRRIIISVSRRIEYDMRVDYYRHLQRLSPSFYDRQQTGDLMTRATSDIEAVRMIVGPAVMYTADTLLTLTFAFTLMVLLSPPLTLTVLAVVPFISALIYVIARRIHRYSTEAQQRYSDLNAMTQEHLSGIRVIRAYCREASESRLYERLNFRYLAANMKLVRLQAILYPTFYSIFGIGMALILYVGGKAIIAGTMSLGDFVAFSAYVGMLAWPVIAVGWVLNLFQRGSASCRRIALIMDRPAEITDRGARADITELKGEIRFDGVYFNYPGTGVEVLRDINITIPPGTSLGIVGSVGSGKTSLVSLIPRLYEVTSGELRLDGHPINHIPLAVLHRDIAVVPQDGFLFSDMLWKNILFACPEYDEKKLIRVAEIAGLTRDVERFPDGFDTWVGERGITLSGGQKQRVSLARALAADPRILILDDCFSAVDTNTEAHILNNLRDALKNQTVIITAHRISTLQWVDRIIVLEDGTVVEEGTHQSLVRQGGRYAKLYRRQLLEEELKDAG